MKFADFIAYAVKSVGQVLLPEVASVFDKTFNEFDSFQDVLDLYEGGIKLPSRAMDKLKHCISWELLKELVRSDGEGMMKFPVPSVIKGTSRPLLTASLGFPI